MNERRDVRTGKKIPKDGNVQYKHTRKGESFWTVSAYECVPTCKCEGYEVCLRLHEIFKSGGAYGSPQWPILSFPTAELADEWMKKLMVFARTIEPTENYEVPPTLEHKTKPGFDGRLMAWLKEQGCDHPLNFNIWGLVPEESP